MVRSKNDQCHAMGSDCKLSTLIEIEERAGRVTNPILFGVDDENRTNNRRTTRPEKRAPLSLSLSSVHTPLELMEINSPRGVCDSTHSFFGHYD